MNLPETISKASTSETMTNTWLATGAKIRKTVGGMTREYVGGIEYNDGVIEFIQTAEGRAIPAGSSGYRYEYMLKDHLGNTRVLLEEDGTVLETSDYYPFGLQVARGQTVTSPENRYKYNGKELQTELGLGQYDYGARFYDPVVGRWNVMDPLAEKYMPFSPYVYAADNPVLFVDIDGRDIYIPIVKGGFTEKAFSQLQSLTTDRLALLNTGQVVNYSSINQISSEVLNIHTLGTVVNTPVIKEFGTGLVNGIVENSDYKLTIVDFNGWEVKVVGDTEKTGEATLYWNKDETGKTIKNSDGSTGMSSASAMGHELIHVKNRIEGKRDGTMVKVNDPDGNNSRALLSKEEINTRIEENRIRKEQLDKDRAIPEIR